MRNHWLVMFKDGPGMTELREQKFAEHLAYLEGNPSIFVDGSPLSSEEDQPPVGGIWILTATNRDEVLALIQNDPMYDAEHRTFEIFATGKRLRTD